MSTEVKKPKPNITLVLKTYWGYLRHYPLLLGIILTSSFVLQITNLIAPLYMRTLFNTLANNAPSAVEFHTLLAILIILSLIWAIDWFATRAQTFTTAHMEAKIMAELQTKAFEYLLGHSHNFFTSNFAGSLTHKVKQFARAFEVLFDGITFQFLPTLLFVAGAVTVLFMRHHTLGILLGVWSVAFICFQVWIAKTRQPIRLERAEMDTKVTGSLADAISNQPAIALFAGSKHELGLFGKVITQWREATQRLWKMEDWTWAAIGLFMLIIQIALMYGALVYWKQGLLTVGDFVLIQAYLLTTFNRLIGVNRDLRGFYGAIADASETIEILETPHEVVDRKGAKPLAVQKGTVTFADVQFAFNPQNKILENLKLEIPGGQKVALVGPSGAGKSTITKLLLRLFDVQGGSIQIDGQNIAAVTQQSLRETISFVPQEPVLFHRSLMDNIRYGRRNATDTEVLEAAKQAHCHEFIQGLPEKYDTFVGERGVKLSGGERQRVAIARAILKNSPILVLDEATSSLDSESESLIQDALETLMQGKTVIVIAHRLSTIMKMDRIIVLEGGKVVADGTHDELLKEEGLYHKLWSIQAGGFIVDEETE
jgi:ATP-binding cassette subfamily B protein